MGRLALLKGPHQRLDLSMQSYLDYKASISYNQQVESSFTEGQQILNTGKGMHIRQIDIH